MTAEAPISHTARAVAMVRAGFVRPSTISGDPEAEQKLAAALAADGPPPRGTMSEYLKARTRFFDYHVLWAVAAHIPQVVLVGAGYDLRGVRFRTPGVRFFELDRPATQADKRQRLASLGIDVADLTFVPIDLALESLEPAMALAGHDPLRPTLFICEGLLLYLDPDTVRALLLGLRHVASPGSRLALTVELGDPTPERQRLHAYLEQIGEPPRSRLTNSDWESLLTATGWQTEDPGERFTSLIPSAA